MTTEKEIEKECLDLLRNHGFSENDFLIHYTDRATEPDSMNGQSIIRGEIAVKKKSTGEQQRYPTGTGSTWPLDFENDLSNGFF